MALGIRFDPSISFKRLLALPQIDEDGNLYADAFDLIGTAAKDITDAYANAGRRQRDQAPSPENESKPVCELTKDTSLAVVAKLPGVAEGKFTSSTAKRLSTLIHSIVLPRMPGFQAINAVLISNDASRTEVGAPHAPSPRPRFTSQHRSSTPAILELPSRDWPLAKIIQRRTEHGMHCYKARWEPTVLDASFVRLVNGTQLVRIEGADWPVESLEQLAQTDVKVSWADSWHPTWEFPTAWESLVDWELANNPRRGMVRERHEWWRYPMSVGGYVDPEMHFAPTLHHSILGASITPGFRCDYTFALLQLLLDVLESGEQHLIPRATIIDLGNRPLRQRLVFNDSFVQAGGIYRLHRPELVRAAIVYVIGHCRIIPCNVCADASEDLPFSKCVVSGKIFDGCCANCVAVRKRKMCDVHADVLLFRGAQNRENDDLVDDDAVSISSSPLPCVDPAARSSVEPGGTSTRTPSTSPTAHAHSAGGVSPELGSDNLVSEDLERPHQPPELSTSSAHASEQLQLENGASSSMLHTVQKMKRSRKRKCPSEDEKPHPSRSRLESEVASKVEGPPLATGLGASPPPPNKTEDDTEDGKGYTHPRCPGNGLPCIHPICGTPVPLGDHFPGMVYKEHEFKQDGEATEDQVQFIISRMQCSDTQFIQKSWDVWRTTHSGGAQHETKYSMLTMSAGFLNRFVRRYCPDLIDLTFED